MRNKRGKQKPVGRGIQHQGCQEQLKWPVNELSICHQHNVQKEIFLPEKKTNFLRSAPRGAK